MEDRRTSERRGSCTSHHPIYMTVGFMFGMIVGSLIHAEHSLIGIGVSVILATVVFHYTFVKNFSVTGLLQKVIKKGS